MPLVSHIETSISGATLINRHSTKNGLVLRRMTVIPYNSKT